MDEAKLSPIEIVTATVMGVTFLISLGITAILTGSETSILPCLAPGIGALIGALMVALRRRKQNISTMAILASVTLVFAGISWAGLGSILEQDIFTSLVCFGPGGLATLIGLGTYWYENQRRGTDDEDEIADESEIGKKTAVITTPTTSTTDIEPTTKNSTILAYQAQLARASIYRQRIHDIIEQKKDSPFAHQFESMATEFEYWHEHVDELVKRLIAFEENELLQEDFDSVPAAIINLEAQMANETDTPLREDMATTLEGYRKHQIQLDSLTTLMRRTELDVEEMITAMGTIYSQLQVLDATNINSDRAKRLSHELEDEVNRLNDLLHAVEDVYDYGR